MGIKDTIKDNYSFILKCMATITAQAIITAGIIATLAAKSTVVSAPFLFAAASTTALGATAVVASPLLPIAAMLLLMGGVGLLSLYFNSCCGGAPRHHYHSRSNWTSLNLFSPPVVDVYSTVPTVPVVIKYPDVYPHHHHNSNHHGHTGYNI
ncbi:hypothetical protein [Legionella hackeliae]|uniref:hypothetical protein n=1 Tax=Legionella hackeliae TaxID=449 RepID=UPI0006986EEA|nr:hypothetical protein [Legionella hackeliae]KTD14192.1 hypothetical protein Lhac_0504 [Legionella hackeliae]STX47137.1 Uncharacterised protein [Legionella hackeliae]